MAQKINLTKENDYIFISKENNTALKASCRIYVDEDFGDSILNEQESENCTSLVEQICNVASLPSLVGDAVGLPDIHGGYGFPIGSVAAFDIDDPNCIVSPGGVGYDINCGVRALRTNLDFSDILKNQEEVADRLFSSVPCGLGGINTINYPINIIDNILDKGIPYLVDSKMVSEDNLLYTEGKGYFEGNSRLISQKAKGRGMKQLGSLGSGNHYLEIQYVSDVYDENMCETLGLKENQIVIFIHSGSRGLGHATCHEHLMKMSKGTNYDDQLISVPFSSKEGQDYMLAMGSAANFAFCNRAVIAERTKKALKAIFPDGRFELIYDSSHNNARKEEHIINGTKYNCLVHRKGASRALPPGHIDLPEKYKDIGQPVLIGGSMGTYSYILCGGPKSLELSFGSTCHGAGRLFSRNQAKRKFTHEEIIGELDSQGIIVKCATRMGIVEEAPGSYKDVDRVIKVSEDVGLTRKACRLRPMIVIKG